MEKATFDRLFQQHVVEWLEEIGFEAHGKSLCFIEGVSNISLIRLGGRLSVAGGISHVLCFRHVFLPNVDKSVPVGFEREVFAYPFKFKPTTLSSLRERKWAYSAQNLSYGYDSIYFQQLRESEVEKDLGELFSFISQRFLPWARRLTPEEAAEQIRKLGEVAWCEKLWLDAYNQYLSSVA